MKPGILGVIGNPRVMRCGESGENEKSCEGGREMRPGACGRCRESEGLGLLVLVRGEGFELELVGSFSRVLRRVRGGLVGGGGLIVEPVDEAVIVLSSSETDDTPDPLGRSAAAASGGMPPSPPSLDVRRSLLLPDECVDGGGRIGAATDPWALSVERKCSASD